MNIVAINLSLGKSQKETTECPLSLFAPAFFDARTAGILPIVASGNQGYQDGLTEPACAPGAVRVGAVYDANLGPISWQACLDSSTAADQVACFSNSASFLTVLAPGALISAAGITQGGTSQATPHVAGAVAVLRAANAFPGETLNQTLSRLTSTGNPIRDTSNGLVIPRIQLEEALLANFSDIPEIGDPDIFVELLVPNGVTTDSTGNIFVHHDTGLQNAISKFAPDGGLFGTVPFGSFGDINRTGRLATDPADDSVLDLLQTGEILRIDPNTGVITPGWDLRSQISVDSSQVYDVATELVRDFSGQIIQPNIVYGDLAVLQRGGQLDLLVTGVSIVTSFVMRVRIIPNQPLDAVVLLASSTQFGNDEGTINVPRGVAVNSSGTALTSLPIAGPPACVVCQGRDVAVSFDIDYSPGTSTTPRILFNQQDLHSRGATSDSLGNFYFATGDVGTSLCGEFGSGAMVVISQSLNSYRCSLVGAVLADSQDVVVNPMRDHAYLTIANNILFGSSGVLDFPIIPPPPASADLSVALSASPNPVTVGEHINYTATINNLDPSIAENITAATTLPANLMFVSASNGCTHADGTINCLIGTLARSASTERHITAIPGVAEQITSTIAVTSTTTDPVSANNTATHTTTVNAAADADLSVTQSDAPDPVKVSEDLTYTVMITNSGPSQATGVEIVDTLPAVFASVRCSGCGSCAFDREILTCPLGEISSGASKTWTLIVTPASEGQITNVVEIHSSVADSDSSINLSVETTLVTAAADLQISKTATPEPVMLGTDLSYTIAISNAGPSSAVDVTVIDTIPSSTVFVSASPGCSEVSGTVTCITSTLADGAVASWDIVLRPTNLGTLINTASVASATPDPDTTNNSASVSYSDPFGSFSNAGEKFQSFLVSGNPTGRTDLFTTEKYTGCEPDY